MWKSYARHYLEYEGLTKEMKSELKTFLNEFAKSRGLADSTTLNYLESAAFFGVFLSKKRYSSYKQASLKDVISYLDSLKNNPGTIAHRKLMLKIFYKWLGKPEISGKLKIKIVKPKAIEAEDCISEGEFLKLLRACNTQRDRTLLNLVFETGARISELLSLRVKDLVFTDNSVYINITKSKTTPRRLFLFDSVNDLKLLLQQHPDPKPDAPLFISKTGNGLKYVGAEQLMLRLARKTKIRKVHWHLFRHSRVSIDARRGMNTVMANKKYGWSGNSTMFNRYSHLSDEDIADWDAQQRGIKNGEKKQDPQEARKCLRCHTLNPWQVQFCGICGMALSEQALNEYNETIRKAGELNELRLKKIEEKVGIV